MSNDTLGHLLEGWASVKGVRFVSRSSGLSTTETVSRDALLDLMRAVQAAERERCAKVCAALDAEFAEVDLPSFVLDMAANRIRNPTS